MTAVWTGDPSRVSPASHPVSTGIGSSTLQPFRISGYGQWMDGWIWQLYKKCTDPNMSDWFTIETDWKLIWCFSLSLLSNCSFTKTMNQMAVSIHSVIKQGKSHWWICQSECQILSEGKFKYTLLLVQMVQSLRCFLRKMIYFNENKWSDYSLERKPWRKWSLSLPTHASPLFKSSGH